MTVVLAVLALTGMSHAGTATLDLGTAEMILEEGARVRVEFRGEQTWPPSSLPVMAVERGEDVIPAETLQVGGDTLSAHFAGGGSAEFRITRGDGFALFRLEKLDLPAVPERLKLFTLAAPVSARVNDVLNHAVSNGKLLALMAATPNVHAFPWNRGGTHLDRAGCSHELTPRSPGKVGERAAAFVATCDSTPSGWSMSGRDWERPLDLAGCRALRVWVHGDGRGEQLKIQLHDGQGGYRDDYISIDFTGWRQLTLDQPALNTLNYAHVTTLNLYYNGLPAGTTVTCLVDHLEALLGDAEQERVLVLEDFEDTDSALFTKPVHELVVETVAKHGLEPAAFGVIACREDQFPQVVERFEEAAGLPSPKLDGVWNKLSPRVKRSYLFLTNFRESQVEQGLALARRGGFDTVLFGQESWSRGTGHYEIDTDRYPEGLEGLKRALGRFKEAGFHVGLHFLAASLYPPDSFLTPVPDQRLVKGARGLLAAEVTETDTFLPLAAFPADFPEEDGGYNGKGQVLQIGEELITYESRSADPPGFAGCKRGHLDTRALAHKSGTEVRHLAREYGYHMYDLDSSLGEEVAANFARVANACGVEMVYFDGSERLQGEHWYYNARLHQNFYDHLKNKNTLLQASSYSHYSWHALARSASADGHGDLKGYLDQRSGGFDWMAQNWMPLDIGWYYGYDPTATPDMFEYVLAAGLGYDSSMSFQVSVEAAAVHPFTGDILDLIGRYEKLRLSGKISEEVRKKLRIDPALQALTPGVAEPELLKKRQEYRLVELGEKQRLQRVIYGPWQTAGDRGELVLPAGEGRLGVQIQVPKGAKLVDPVIRLGDHRWSWEGELKGGQFVFFWPGEFAKLYAPGMDRPQSGERAPEVSAGGRQGGQFTCKSASGEAPVIRFTLQTGENIEL